jgi:hypothetical protein
MKRHILALLLLFLMAFPASAQDATPTPVGPRVDPLAANPAKMPKMSDASDSTSRGGIVGVACVLA